jgi:GT2 family glycosyltransferase
VVESPPPVAIVILNWNGCDDVLGCVASLPRLTYPNYTATVVDNASSDGSVTALRERFPRQRVLALDKNYGFAGGNNRGMRDAVDHGAEFVLLLNNDTELHPELVGELVRVASSDPRVGAVGAKNLCLEDPGRIWGAFGEITYGHDLVRVYGKGEPDGPRYRCARDVDWVIGNGMLLSRDAIEAVGGFDESFFGYHEDVDWCVRARRKGFRIVFNGDAVIYHRGFGAAKAGRPVPFPVLYFLGRNAILFARKHGSAWQCARLSTAFLLHVARLGLKDLLEQPEVKPSMWLLRGFADGLRGRLPLQRLGLQ